MRDRHQGDGGPSRLTSFARGAASHRKVGGGDGWQARLEACLDIGQVSGERAQIEIDGEPAAFSNPGERAVEDGPERARRHHCPEHERRARPGLQGQARGLGDHGDRIGWAALQQVGVHRRQAGLDLECGRHGVQHGIHCGHALVPLAELEGRETDQPAQGRPARGQVRVGFVGHVEGPPPLRLVQHRLEAVEGDDLPHAPGPRRRRSDTGELREGALREELHEGEMLGVVERRSVEYARDRVGTRRDEDRREEEVSHGPFRASRRPPGRGRRSARCRSTGRETGRRPGRCL